MALDPNFDLSVLAYDSSVESSFNRELMEGVNWFPLSDREREDLPHVIELVASREPDVIVVAGWLNAAYVALFHQARFSKCHMVMGMDTPWRNEFRQRCAPFLLKRFLRKIDAVVVPGERSWQYARHLGFDENQIHRGLYGIDYSALSLLFQQRNAGRWPQAFLFAGRYHHQKGIDVMIDAYKAYRMKVAHPWPLVCCGKGKLEGALTGNRGITNLGFLQPSEIRSLYTRAGAFLLPSRYDPWPLALVEACAAGLPVIASNACGSAVECVRDNISGYLTATAESGALTEALVRVHQTYDQLPSMGAIGQTLARPYSADSWLENWRELIFKTLERTTPGRQENRSE